MGELVLLSSGVQMTKGNRLLHHYFTNKKLREKTILLLGEKDPTWFHLCREAFVKIGFESSSIFISEQFNRELSETNIDYLYLAEGNTFQQLKFLKDNVWIPFIINAWKNGATYIGISAGAHLACKTVKAALDFDNCNVYPTLNYDGLGLFNGVVIPHYNEDDQARVNAKRKALETLTEKEVLLLRNSQMAIINAEKITVVDLDCIEDFGVTVADSISFAGALPCSER